MDIRQWPAWGKYLGSISWKIETISGRQFCVRKIPGLPFSVIKSQRPQNPLSFSQIDQLAKKYKALFVLIEPALENYQESAFKKSGYHKSAMILAHTSTTLINLKKSEKELLLSFSENARRNIKKAKNFNLTTKTVFLKNDKDHIWFGKFFELFKNLSEIKKFYIPSYDEYLKKMQAFKNNSFIAFAFQNGESNPVAAVWIGFYQKTGVYMNTGILDEGYRTLANYLLVWEALKVCQELKLEVFDFEGIFDPRFPKDHPRWANFTEFKRRFHGAQVDYPPPQIKIYNPIFGLFYLCSKIFHQ